MTQPTSPNTDVPLPGNGRRPSAHQETLLLTDVPEASDLMAAPVASSLSPSQLSSTALTALSQRYDILAEAGHGSMGNVYKARDRETGEIVALKLLKPEIASDQSMMERFKNELLFARKITHKNVCRLHEFNRIDGIAYTSMEFVEGESLRSVLNRFGSLPPRKAIDLVGQICSGLKEAHAQGIVHRDLKPENIMIDAQGNVKIMDFGIARSMEAVTRLTGSMVGTPAYMAPEQVAGKPVDYRTDIYSLGLIMYEVFTGAPAFQADNAVAVALKQMRESPTPPHEVEPSIPVSIERTILKCIEKEPTKRFQTIADLDNALRGAGTSSGTTTSAIAAANRSGHVAAPSRPFNSLPAPQRASKMGWVLVGVLLVVSTVAGRHWMLAAQATENLAPPRPMFAPKPPDFALEIPAPAAAIAQPAAAPTKAAAPRIEIDSPRASAPVERAPQTPAQDLAAKEVQQRADQAFGESSLPAASPVTDNSPSYLWVGRFERQDPAQNAVKKIEGLGLPATVVPRRNEKGDFFVVVTGPFGGKRIPSVIEWLNAQGFHNVRQIPNFLSSLKAKQNINP